LIIDYLFVDVTDWSTVALIGVGSTNMVTAFWHTNG